MNQFRKQGNNKQDDVNEVNTVHKYIYAPSSLIEYIRLQYTVSWVEVGVYSCIHLQFEYI
jgi:hypothetical protein